MSEFWTAARVLRLAELWAAGLSMTAIGRDLGIGKNAVAGKVHRLILPPRASPIKRAGEGAAPAQPRPRLVGAEPPSNGRGAMGAGTLEALGVVDRSRAAPPPPPPAWPRASHPCCWPIGEPRTADFRYCDAPGLPGRSYCATHYSEAYVVARPRTEAQLAADAAKRMAADAAKRMAALSAGRRGAGRDLGAAWGDR